MINEKTILIIDKNLTTRYNLKLMLWNLNCMTYESEELNEAIAFIVTKRPGKIFVSLDTVKASNFAILHEIKKLYNCLLIIYSNQISKDDLIHCINVSVNDILINPCDHLERLRSIVTS